jgi:hypothetical protein
LRDVVKGLDQEVDVVEGACFRGKAEAEQCQLDGEAAG